MKFIKKMEDIRKVKKAMEDAKIKEDAIWKCLAALERQMITIQENQVEFEQYLKDIKERLR